MRVLAFLMTLAAGSSAQAIVNADGCYQTYLPGSMFPAVCISGSNQEAAIPTAKVAIFGTNSNDVIWCGKANKMVRHSFDKGANHIEFSFETSTGMKSIQINGLKNGQGEKGRIVFNEVDSTAELQYVRIDDKNTLRLVKDMLNSQECSQL